MIIYLLLLLISIMLSFADLTNMCRKCKMIYGSVFVGVCIILSGVRWNTGPDWAKYYGIYAYNYSWNDFIDVAESHEAELGYGLLNYVHNHTINDYNMFLFMIVIPVLIIKARWIFKYTRYPLIAMMVFYTTHFGDIFFIRQYIAVAIVLLGFDFIIKKKFWRYFLTVIIAATIHTSAAIAIIIYWVYHARKLSAKILSIILLIFLICDITGFNMYVLEVFLDSFSTDYGNAVYKVHAYYLREQSGSDFGNNVPQYIHSLLAYGRRLLFVPLYIYFFSKMNKCNPYVDGTFRIVLFGHALFMLMSCVSYEFAGRLTLYFIFFEILLLSYLFYTAKKSKYPIWCFLVGYSIIKYFFLIYNLSHAYLPYETVF